MGKKKRARKTSVYSSVEGDTEHNFLEHLKFIYSDLTKTSFPDNPKKGGNPDVIIGAAIRSCHFDRSFSWIDEDVEISDDTRISLIGAWGIPEKSKNDFMKCEMKNLQCKFNLNKRKPILVVSSPICCEAIILKTLGIVPCHQAFDKKIRAKQIADLKAQLKSILPNKNHQEFYKVKLGREVLENMRKEIPKLDLLIKMVSP